MLCIHKHSCRVRACFYKSFAHAVTLTQAKSCPQVFEEIFGGAFLDQKICKGCDHTYDREESFLSLSLPVKSKRQLEESLKEFVKGDWLEGDNAYFCEKCKEKRDTLKRTCIKTLPPVLVVHLKRFDYDWEAGRAIKYDDYFEVWVVHKTFNWK